MTRRGHLDLHPERGVVECGHDQHGGRGRLSHDASAPFASVGWVQRQARPAAADAGVQRVGDPDRIDQPCDTPALTEYAQSKICGLELGRVRRGRAETRGPASSAVGVSQVLRFSSPYGVRISGRHGGVPDSVPARKAVRRKLDRAGSPWATFHTMRRTVERQLMDADVDPRVIMAVMGHDPATSWASYVDHESVDASAAARALA
jgi:hypothetical protein